ncbi:hypothetical protein BpHYR1_027927 [Brachionus plicatilis]|uniref:Uncharacterized protein n=1 Tax=Brachionus plicatilis TaxID=10195 RepID=A0A3M7RZ19_BRAPC|nr:hypothetical protein BpHYR1_027927 [Brachionus plicatilis]
MFTLVPLGPSIRSLSLDVLEHFDRSYYPYRITNKNNYRIPLFDNAAPQPRTHHWRRRYTKSRSC